MLMGVAVATVLGAASCKKSVIPAAKGDSVLFSAGLGGSESGTKTAYAGDNASDRTLAENINWLSGDQIRIWCKECSEPTLTTYGGMDHCADYTVTPESTATQGKIAVNPGTVGLRWGEPKTTHYFYAVYPSPNTTGKNSDAGELGTPSGSPTVKTPFSFTGHIPTTQAISGYTTESDVVDKNGNPIAVAAPDMTNLYMASQGVSAKPEDTGDGVFLTFTPLSTAIEFTITNDMTADDAMMQVESVSLLSENHNISGAFTADLATAWAKPVSKYTASGTSGARCAYENTYPACVEATGVTNGKTVTIDFSGTDACTTGIAKGRSLRFTVFLLPVTPGGSDSDDVDDLSFVITRKDGEGYKSLQTKLSRTDGKDGNRIPFPVHKKTYVTGILVPDSARWVIDSQPIVTPWENNDCDELDFGEDVDL